MTKEEKGEKGEKVDDATDKSAEVKIDKETGKEEIKAESAEAEAEA